MSFSRDEGSAIRETINHHRSESYESRETALDIADMWQRREWDQLVDRHVIHKQDAGTAYGGRKIQTTIQNLRANAAQHAFVANTIDTLWRNGDRVELRKLKVI